MAFQVCSKRQRDNETAMTTLVLITDVVKKNSMLWGTKSVFSELLILCSKEQQVG